jgi:hypothetical protein
VSDTGIGEIRKRIRNSNRLLERTGAEPPNTHRALLGALAVASFAGGSGMRPDVQADPETALSDLLADLMHWCDVREIDRSRLSSIDFDSALTRARHHYDAERDRMNNGP